MYVLIVLIYLFIYFFIHNVIQNIYKYIDFLFPGLYYNIGLRCPIDFAMFLSTARIQHLLGCSPRHGNMIILQIDELLIRSNHYQLIGRLMVASQCQ